MSGHSPTGRSLILVEIGLSLHHFRPTFVNNFFEFYRNKPFVTQIGVGKVIRGWDEGAIHIADLLFDDFLMLHIRIRCSPTFRRSKSRPHSAARPRM